MAALAALAAKVVRVVMPVLLLEQFLVDPAALAGRVALVPRVIPLLP
jgi:hypothetical protein